MRRADYSYQKLLYKNEEFLIIKDLNLGSISVTNDMENVLDEISETLGTSLEGMMILYQDSTGLYDGVRYDNRTVSFIILQRNDVFSACEALLKKQERALLNRKMGIYFLVEAEIMMDDALSLMADISDSYSYVKEIRQNLHQMKKIISQFCAIQDKNDEYRKTAITELLWIRSKAASLIEVMDNESNSPYFCENLRGNVEKIYHHFDRLYQEVKSKSQ